MPALAASCLTGSFIDNRRIQLLEILGSGSYGVVYRAVHVKTSKHFAVKCLPKPEDLSSRRSRVVMDRYKSEIDFHRRLSVHPGILPLYKAIEDDRYIYMVLELCPGGDLFGGITDLRVFHRDDDLVRHIFLQILDGIDHMHRNGIYHRDLKPENILCDADITRVYIADFGLATTDVVSTQFGCGSAFYMSPECIARITDRYSPRHGDVWALGCILLNMITGRNAWRAAVADDPCFAAFLHDPLFLLKTLPISPGANDILIKIFTMNPLARITLTDLRARIIALETFFLTPAQLARANPVVRAAASEFESIPPPATTTSSLSQREEGTRQALRVDVKAAKERGVLSISSDEAYLYDSPEDDVPPRHFGVSGKLSATPVCQPVTVFAELPTAPESLPHPACLVPGGRPVVAPAPFRETRVADIPPALDADNDDDSQDSSGPITPETFPVNIDIEIPELDLSLEDPRPAGRDVTLHAISAKQSPAEKLRKGRFIDRLRAHMPGSGLRV